MRARIEQDSWNIITRVIRRYPDNKAELKEEGGATAYRLRAEVEAVAVENALVDFNVEEQKVISERFWKERGKCVPYEKIYNANYSPRQMRRIAKRMMRRVGEELGEIKQKYL
jgi:hypothetical protein